MLVKHHWILLVHHQIPSTEPERHTYSKKPSQILLEISSTHQDTFTSKGKNFTFRKHINDIPPPFYFTMSSPMEVYNSSHGDDSDDIYTEPSMCCDHQNQLAHYNWAGAPHEDLSDRCKQTLGISVQNMQLSSNNGE